MGDKGGKKNKDKSKKQKAIKQEQSTQREEAVEVSEGPSAETPLRGLVAAPPKLLAASSRSWANATFDFASRSRVVQCTFPTPVLTPRALRGGCRGVDHAAYSAVEQCPPRLFFALSVGCFVCVSAGFRSSPMTPFSGQTGKSRQFLQPTARAIGQRVISASPSNDAVQPHADDSAVLIILPVPRYKSGAHISRSHQ